MAWVIRRGARSRFHSIEWDGRAGRATWGRRSESTEGVAAALQSIVGVHCAFGDLASESHASVARLGKRRPRPGPLAVFGDMNMNMHSRREEDELSQVMGHAPALARAEAREEAREAFRTLAGSIGLRIRLPDRTHRGPGGTFLCLRAQHSITRILPGELAEPVAPSLLDYAMEETGGENMTC